VSGTIACSGASRGVGICVEQDIAEGGQQVHHCINQGSGTARTVKMKYHLVQESSKNGLIKVEFIRCEEQLGDILTKPLNKVKFLELHANIGLIDVDRHNKA
jgi:hypothetical protein